MQPAPPPPQATPAAAAPAIARQPQPSAAAVYQGYRAQREVLSDQLEELESTRRDLNAQIEGLGPSNSERQVLETRLQEVNEQIAAVDQLLATNALQLSQAAAVPGAVVQPTRIVREGPPEEAYIVAIVFMFVFLLPISIAFARRIWRRSAAVMTSLPRELGDRLSRMEQAIEATAVEVERIGEGQRFITRLFSENEAARALAAGGPQLIERKSGGKSERLP